MDLSSFYSQFRDETADNVRMLQDGLLTCDDPGSSDAVRQEAINAIFRAVHTIKGSARMLGFEAIGRLAHSCENVLGEIRAGQRDMTRSLADTLLRAGDALLEMANAILDPTIVVSIDSDALITVLDSPVAPPATAEPAAPPAAAEPAAPTAPPATPAPAEPAPQPQAGAASPPPEPVPAPVNTPRASAAPARQTVRVRVDKLDRLLDLAGELAVSQQGQALHLAALEELRAHVEQQHLQLVQLERDLMQMRFSARERTVIDKPLRQALDLGEQANRALKQQADWFTKHVAEAKLLVEDLEQDVMAVRLLPVSSLYANLPRAVRDLAGQANKQIGLELRGETTELDRKVIEALSDPLMHLIRNAIDHGIEPPETRTAAGKPAQGTITITAQAFGSYATLIIADDGRGVDPVQVRNRAIQKGLISPELAERLTEQEVLELIFTPGFSTAQMITDLSGRGVGMDVVRTNVLELGGHVQFASQLGRGSSITLTLPLTLVTTRVLLIEVGEHTFAIPAAACNGTIWTYPGDVRTVEQRATIFHAGMYIPLLRMADLLDVAGAQAFPAARRTPTLLLGTAQRPLAVVVDHMVDEREVVVKPLGPLMERQKRYSGAIRFGDGRLILLLNPLVLAQVARGMSLVTRVADRAVALRRSRLLVADDSFTTRELISSILQSAGYDVITAIDGQDALNKLRDESVDLVVSDVEMPHIDGFELTRRIRLERGLRDLPVVIVTSLASETYRRRGLEVGAQAYIVKSQFNQGNLLETIRQLLGA